MNTEKPLTVLESPFWKMFVECEQQQLKLTRDRLKAVEHLKELSTVQKAHFATTNLEPLIANEKASFKKLMGSIIKFISINDIGFDEFETLLRQQGSKIHSLSVTLSLSEQERLRVYLLDLDFKRVEQYVVYVIATSEKYLNSEKLKYDVKDDKLNYQLLKSAGLSYMMPKGFDLELCRKAMNDKFFK